jgi:4,5-dihydroxyphthalate decarboxylase
LVADTIQDGAMSKFALMPATGKVSLKTNLADYAITKRLKSGEVPSDLVDFQFLGTKIANQGFKPMVREGKFDAGELAIVTFLQAKAWGYPLVLLPAVMLGRFQHNSIFYDCRNGDMAPKDIEGKRVGVRAYSQTTGVWVRGILAHEYGVDISKVKWATYEEPHVPDYADPAFLDKFDPQGKSMEALMFEGVFDAVIMSDLEDPRAKTLIPDSEEAALDWHRRTGAVSVNHFFVVSEEVARREDVVREIWRMLVETKKGLPAPAYGIDLCPFGLEANRRNLELIIQFAYEQQMLPRMMSVDELFTDLTANLKP